MEVTQAIHSSLKISCVISYIVMALIRFFFTTSLLLLSFLILASANYDYSYRSEQDVNNQESEYHTSYSTAGKSKPDDTSKPEGYDHSPKQGGVKSRDYGHGLTPEAYKSNPENDEYKPKQDVEKSKSEDKSKPQDYGYGSTLDEDEEEDEFAEEEYSPQQGLYKSEPEVKSKPEINGYGTKPDNVGSDKNEYSPKPAEKPKSENYGYGAKPDTDKNGYRHKSENDDYGAKSDANKSKPKSEYKPKSENKGYGSKPDTDNSKKSKNGDESKPENSGYGSKPDANKSKSEDNEYNSKPDFSNSILPIGIEGLVLCKSGSKYYPIQGAVARVTCEAVDENGYGTKSFFNCRGTTDAKGYFLATLSPLKLTGNSLKIKECKAFLEKSPLETCEIPSDVNKGISGAVLTSYKILHDKNMKLYSAKPFFFTSSDSGSAPNGY